MNPGLLDDNILVHLANVGYPGSPEVPGLNPTNYRKIIFASIVFSLILTEKQNIRIRIVNEMPISLFSFN